MFMCKSIYGQFADDEVLGVVVVVVVMVMVMVVEGESDNRNDSVIDYKDRCIAER